MEIGRNPSRTHLEPRRAALRLRGICPRHVPLHQRQHAAVWESCICWLDPVYASRAKHSDVPDPHRMKRLKSAPHAIA